MTLVRLRVWLGVLGTCLAVGFLPTNAWAATETPGPTPTDTSSSAPVTGTPTPVETTAEPVQSDTPPPSSTSPLASGSPSTSAPASETAVVELDADQFAALVVGIGLGAAFSAGSFFLGMRR